MTKLTNAQQQLINSMFHGAKLSCGVLSGLYSIQQLGVIVPERVSKALVHALNRKNVIRESARPERYTGSRYYELTPFGRAKAN